MPNTDFILMATAKATAGLCDPGGSTVAYATWCQMDQFNRYACRVACYCHATHAGLTSLVPVAQAHYCSRQLVPRSYQDRIRGEEEPDLGRDA